jgi:hypothetical protein
LELLETITLYYKPRINLTTIKIYIKFHPKNNELTESDLEILKIVSARRPEHDI